MIKSARLYYNNTTDCLPAISVATNTRLPQTQGLHIGANPYASTT
jgi:hypothetical protein